MANIPPPLQEILKKVQMRERHENYMRETIDIYHQVRSRNVFFSFNISKMFIGIFQMNHDVFMKSFFMDGLMRFMQYDIGHTYADRGLKFLANLAVSIKSDNMNYPVFKSVINELTDVTSEAVIVRKRICNFLFLLLSTMKRVNGPIEDTNKIIEQMKIFLQYTHATIREQATKVLLLFQCHDDVIELLLFHLNEDPSTNVRILLLKSIIKTDTTVPLIADKMKDIRENVRFAVLSALKGQHIELLSNAQRCKLFKQIINDSSMMIKKLFSDEVLPLWLNHYGIVALLSAVRCDDEESEDFLMIAKFICDHSVEKIPIDELLKELPIDRRIIPMQQLTVQLAVFWHSIIEFAMKTDQDDGPFEAILCDCKTFCEYIDRFIEHAEDSPENDAENQAILLVLFKMINLFEIEEEFNRDLIIRFMKNKFQNQIQILNAKMIEELIKATMVALPMDRIDGYFNEIMENTHRFFIPNYGRLSTFIAMIENDDQRNSAYVIEQEIIELNKKQIEAMHNEEYEALDDIRENLTFWHQQIHELLKRYSCYNDESEIDALVPNISTEMVLNYLQMYFHVIQKMPPNTPDLLLRTFYNKFIQLLIKSPEFRAIALKCGVALAVRHRTMADGIILICMELLINEEDIDLCCTAIVATSELMIHHRIEYPNNRSIDQPVIKMLFQLLPSTEDADMAMALLRGIGLFILTGFVRDPELIAIVLAHYIHPNVSNKNEQILELMFNKMHKSNMSGLLIDALIPAIKLIATVHHEVPAYHTRIRDLFGFVIKLTRSVPHLQNHIATNILKFAEENVFIEEMDVILNDVTKQLGSLKINANEEMCDGLLPIIDQLLDDADVSVKRVLKSFRHKLLVDQSIETNQSDTMRHSQLENTMASGPSVVSPEPRASLNQTGNQQTSVASMIYVEPNPVNSAVVVNTVEPTVRGFRQRTPRAKLQENNATASTKQKVRFLNEILQINLLILIKFQQSSTGTHRMVLRDRANIMQSK